MTIEKFIKRNRRNIQGIISRFADEETSKDIEQEVYIKMWRFSAHKKPFGYIKTLVVNTCKDFIKSKYNKCSRLNTSDDEELILIRDNHETPLQKTESLFRQKTIADAINRLPHKLKEVIILYDIEDLDQNKIAQKLNCPIGTVKSRLFKARKLLQVELKEFIEGESL